MNSHILQSKDIFLRFLQPEDASILLAFYLNNREFLAPWEPRWQEAYYSLEGQRERLEAQVSLREADHSYAFGIFLKRTDELIGRINLSSITRGAFLSANLGYSLAQIHNGRGYATEAVRLVLGFAFKEIELHRLQAATLLHNYGSIRVLTKAGFRHEGVALRYIKIANQWQDHNIFAITAEEFNLTANEPKN